MLIALIEGFGAQLLQSIDSAVAYLEELQRQNVLYRLALMPLLFIIKSVEIGFIKPMIVGWNKTVEFWYPFYCQYFRDLLLFEIPNSVRAYNKTGLLIYFVEAYCAAMCVHRMFAVNRAAVIYIYLILKLILLVIPFMFIVSTERYYAWAVGATLMLLEIYCSLFVIQCVGRGIDWNSGQSFYHHWGPHYRYRRMTTNRKLTLELVCYLYPAFKITILTSTAFCKYSDDLLEFRLKFPHRPTIANIVSTPAYDAVTDIANLERQKLGFRPFPKAEVSSPVLPDLDYLAALTEPDTVVNMRYGILFLLALSSLSVYSIILAGWASNSKYAFIGALRSAAQMISYEVAISLILLPVVLLAGSLNLSAITYMQSITVWFLFPLLPASVLFLIAMLAETNRTPFDLPEAEAELVAGYNVDYSSLPFAMFFLGEYCNMILIATLYCLLFLSGGLNSLGVSTALVLSLKAAVIWVFFVNVRATLPRYRYDQLMDIGWKVFLPIAGGFLIFIFGLLIALDALPYTTELPFDVWNVLPKSNSFFDNISHHAPTFPRGPYYPGIDCIDEVLQPYNALNTDNYLCLTTSLLVAGKTLLTCLGHAGRQQSVSAFITNRATKTPAYLEMLLSHLSHRSIDGQKPIALTLANHFPYYPTPTSLNYNRSFGSLAGLFFTLQLVTGIFMAMYYVPYGDWAFTLVEQFLANVDTSCISLQIASLWSLCSFTYIPYSAFTISPIYPFLLSATKSRPPRRPSVMWKPLAADARGTVGPPLRCFSAASLERPRYLSALREPETIVIILIAFSAYLLIIAGFLFLDTAHLGFRWGSSWLMIFLLCLSYVLVPAYTVRIVRSARYQQASLLRRLAIGCAILCIQFCVCILVDVGPLMDLVFKEFNVSSNSCLDTGIVRHGGFTVYYVLSDADSSIAVQEFVQRIASGSRKYTWLLQVRGPEIAPELNRFASVLHSGDKPVTEQDIHDMFDRQYKLWKDELAAVEAAEAAKDRMVLCYITLPLAVCVAALHIYFHVL